MSSFCWEKGQKGKKMNAGTKEPITVTSLHEWKQNSSCYITFFFFFDVSPENMPQPWGIIGFHGIIYISPRLKLCQEETRHA